MNVVFTQLFREIVKKLSKEDISNLCEIDDFFRSLCRYESGFIERELDKRKFYVIIETDYDVENVEDIENVVTVTKTEPEEMYGDFVQTKLFQLLDYSYNEVYVLFHFNGEHIDVIELYTDKEKAESDFNDVTSQYGLDVVTRKQDILDYTLSGNDDDDEFWIDRWRLIRVTVSE